MVCRLHRFFYLRTPLTNSENKRPLDHCTSANRNRPYYELDTVVVPTGGWEEAGNLISTLGRLNHFLNCISNSGGGFHPPRCWKADGGLNFSDLEEGMYIESPQLQPTLPLPNRFSINRERLILPETRPCHLRFHFHLRFRYHEHCHFRSRVSSCSRPKALTPDPDSHSRTQALL